MLQDKINEISPYFQSLETYNEALIVRVKFPEKWKVFPSEDNKIRPARSEKKPFEYFYYGDSGQIALEDIFDFIKETIEINKSIEIKAKLLVQKIKELEELFEITPLEELKTLEFKVSSKKTKVKRKTAKKANKSLKSESATTISNITESGSTSVKNASGATESVVNVSLSKDTINKIKLAKNLSKNKV